MNLNCEYVREVYPDVLNQKLDAATANAVRAHIARCSDCREEVAVIERLHAIVVEIPAGLQERIVADISRPRQRFGLRKLAYAATVAAAIVGGSLLLDSREEPDVNVEAEGLGFVTVEDAMVSGTSSLRDLTIEELEQLLGEIES